MALNGQLVVNLLTTKPNWDAPPSTSGQISGGHFQSSSHTGRGAQWSPLGSNDRIDVGSYERSFKGVYMSKSKLELVKISLSLSINIYIYKIDIYI